MEGAPAAILIVLAAELSACAPPVSRGGFDAPDPASKIYAIETAMRSQDRHAVPQIVEQLNNDDPAVRMLAASALEQLTGQTLGYDYSDPPDARREAIRRWKDYLASTSADHELPSEFEEGGR
jgi:hypothetical protein